MTPVDLEPIKARLAAATPGPWAAGDETHPKDRYWNSAAVYAAGVDRLPNLVYATGLDADADAEAASISRWNDRHSRGWVCETHNYFSIPDEEHDANQRLIAHAPADLAALIAEVEHLRSVQ